MPYKSTAQAGYMHEAEKRGEISPKVVADFDAASKGKMKGLPYHVKAAKAHVAKKRHK